LSEAYPDLPVEDRAADTWAPLVAVADAAGGDWPTRARVAAEVLTREAEDADSATSLNVRLLADIRDVFQPEVKFVKSAALCELLRAVDDAPWRDFDLNPSKLGRRLREYGIKTAHNTARTERGYRIEDFSDAFDRYLVPATPSNPVQGVQHGSDQHEPPDTFQTLDTLKASSPPKVSGQSGRSEPQRTAWTPLDGNPDRQCRQCGARLLIDVPGRDVCERCRIAAVRGAEAAS